MADDRQDPAGNDGQPGSVEGSPGPTGRPLVFRPDPARTARAARLRLLLLGLTGLFVLAALILMVAYRPRFVAPNRPVVSDSTTPRGLVSAPVQDQSPESSRPAVPTDRFAPVRSALAGIDSCIAVAEDRWLRAGQLLPDGAMDSARVATALTAASRAGVLLDSVTQDLAAARRDVDIIRDAASSGGPGQDAYHVSLVYTAADRYLGAVSDRARERRSGVAMIEQGLRALALGDTSEYDVKLDAANSYQYQADNRQRTVRRLAVQLAEAVQELK